MKRFTKLYNHSPDKINFRELFGNYNLIVLPWQWINCTFQGEEYPFRLLSPLPLSVLILFLVLVCHKTWLKSLAIHMWLISNLPFFYCSPPTRRHCRLFYAPFSPAVTNFHQLFDLRCDKQIRTRLHFYAFNWIVFTQRVQEQQLTEYIKADSLAPWSRTRYLLTCLKNPGVVVTHIMKFVSYSDEMHGLISFPRLSKANLRCCLPQWDLQWDL